MISYYIYSVVSALSLVLFRKAHFLFIPIAVGLFLYLLPSTGWDYDHYQEAYDLSYFVNEFPWFYTTSGITAEPLYLWYNSAFGVLVPLGFELFLVLNFLFCFLMSFTFFDGRKDLLLYFWISMIPVILPTLFYFSPRSSISFFLVLTGFFKLCQNRNITALILIFIGCMFHSQYILISVFILSYSVLLMILSRCSDVVKKRVLILFGALTFILILNINVFIGVIEGVLGQLPSSKVAVSKLHYLSDARGGLRATSILSIVVFPSLMYVILRKYRSTKIQLFSKPKTDQRFILMLTACVVFGFLINVLFFNAPHLSGRLGRFSDYLGMTVVMPLSLMFLGGKKILFAVLIIFALAAPFLYPTVYNFFPK